jgi:hypothetical protein
MLHVSVAKRYVPYQSLESKQMLQEILDHPENLFQSIQRYTNSLTTQMTFGWRTISSHDPKLEMLFESVERFEQLALTSLTALVDFFPILQSLPDFLMPMKAFATKVYEDTTELYVGHWLEVKDSIRSGTSKPCLSVDLAKLQEEEGFSDEQAAYISGEYTSSDAMSLHKSVTCGPLLKLNRYSFRGWVRNDRGHSLCFCASYDLVSGCSGEGSVSCQSGMW